MPAPGVTMLSQLTGGDLARNAVWRELLGPGNLGDVLNAVLTVEGRCWGMLHLYREQGSPWFTGSDAAVVASLSTGLASRLRASLTAPVGVPASGDGHGTIILDRALELVASTPTAHRWLARLPARSADGHEPLPGFIYALATRARLDERAKADGSPIDPSAGQLRIRAADGTRLLLRAAPLSSSVQLGDHLKPSSQGRRPQPPATDRRALRTRPRRGCRRARHVGMGQRSRSSARRV